MSASADLQSRISELLGAPGALRVEMPIVRRRTKDLAAEIEAASANQGLCIFVMPPKALHAQQDVPFVFFDRSEIRVRIIEQPAISARFGADAYDIFDDVAMALHWKTIPEILAHPLYLAASPMEMVEDPRFRIIDCLFEAVYGLVPA